MSRPLLWAADEVILLHSLNILIRVWLSRVSNPGPLGLESNTLTFRPRRYPSLVSNLFVKVYWFIPFGRQACLPSPAIPRFVYTVLQSSLILIKHGQFQLFYHSSSSSDSSHFCDSSNLSDCRGSNSKKHFGSEAVLIPVWNHIELQCGSMQFFWFQQFTSDNSPCLIPIPHFSVQFYWVQVANISLETLLCGF